MLNEAKQRAPLGELVDIMDVGYSCGFLSTPYARRMSGATLYVDGGVKSWPEPVVAGSVLRSPTHRLIDQSARLRDCSCIARFRKLIDLPRS